MDKLKIGHLRQKNYILPIFFCVRLGSQSFHLSFKMFFCLSVLFLIHYNYGMHKNIKEKCSFEMNSLKLALKQFLLS